jgi:DNA repair protein RecO (recombination protein O)
LIAVPETFVTRAILLRAVATGESDRVVTLLGRTTGRISAVARNARKSTRRFGGGLGLAATGLATLRERPGADLALLEAFEIVRGRHNFGADLGTTAQAGYVAELCDQLCAPRQADPALYDWLEEFLDALDDRGPSAVRLRAFELGLLHRLGLGSDFASCVACGRRDLGDETARLEPDRGGITCVGCARRGTPIPPQVRRALVDLQDIVLAEAEQLAPGKEVNLACRSAIAELFAVHLVRPLKSLEFLRKLQGG